MICSGFPFCPGVDPGGVTCVHMTPIFIKTPVSSGFTFCTRLWKVCTRVYTPVSFDILTLKIPGLLRVHFYTGIYLQGFTCTHIRCFCSICLVSSVFPNCVGMYKIHLHIHTPTFFPTSQPQNNCFNLCSFYAELLRRDLTRVLVRYFLINIYIHIYVFSSIFTN